MQTYTKFWGDSKLLVGSVETKYNKKIKSKKQKTM